VPARGADYNWGWYEMLPSTEKGAGNLRFLFSGIRLTVALSSVSIIFSMLVAQKIRYYITESISTVSDMRRARLAWTI
jgi:hypothetical protein